MSTKLAWFVVSQDAASMAGCPGLIAGPCCALLTARWAPTAAAGCFALALGVLLGLAARLNNLKSLRVTIPATSIPGSFEGSGVFI